jgi:hypothetical protein
MFRSVFEVLGTRRGGTWIADVKRSIPDLSDALAPQSAPLSWHRTSAFVSMLESLSKDPRECRTAAMQLGRAAATSSFAQFYGADISAVTPAQALGVADMLWRSYHSWGATVVDPEPTRARVTVRDGIPNPLLCSSTSGLFAGLVGQARGIGVRVEHTKCVSEGASECVFELRWQLPQAR